MNVIRDETFPLPVLCPPKSNVVNVTPSILNSSFAKGGREGRERIIIVHSLILLLDGAKSIGQQYVLIQQFLIKPYLTLLKLLLIIIIIKPIIIVLVVGIIILLFIHLLG